MAIKLFYTTNTQIEFLKKVKFSLHANNFTNLSYAIHQHLKG